MDDILSAVYCLLVAFCLFGVACQDQDLMHLFKCVKSLEDRLEEIEKLLRK